MKYFISIFALALIILLSQTREITMTREVDYRQPYLYSWQGPSWPEPKERIAVITAYNPTAEQTDDDPAIMASGRNAYEGAAACPREIKFGVAIEINGKTYWCEDRLARKYDDRFDLLMFDEQEAKKWGKQELLVLVY